MKKGEWKDINDATEECVEFLNSLYDSQLMKEYNIFSMSHECRMGYANTPLIEDTEKDDFNNKMRKRIDELHSVNKRKVEEISKQHQNEVVSVKLFSLLKLTRVRYLNQHLF